MAVPRFQVAAVQASPVFLNLPRTVEKACDLIGEAAAGGAQIAVFPEAFLSGYPDWVWVVPNSNAPVLNDLYGRLVENAVAIPGEATRKLCDAARKARIHVVMGMNERNAEASNASLYNTLLFIDDTGEVLGKRRKLMPTGAERLIWAQGDGSTLHAMDTRLGRIGGLICWENFMPLARQALYDDGVQLLVTPTWDKSDNWIASLQHIAREGGVFVVSCCQALRTADIPDDYEFKKLYPAGREWINGGRSCVINPRGQIIAGPLEAEEGLVMAEIDPAEIVSAKRMFDAAGHYARPDVFEFSVRRPA